MSHFDERSGVVYCKTGWGQWGQTIEEVFIEVDVVEGTKARDVHCHIKPNSISLAVSGKVLIQVYTQHYAVMRLSCTETLLSCHREICVELC